MRETIYAKIKCPFSFQRGIVTMERENKEEEGERNTKIGFHNCMSPHITLHRLK